MPTLTVSLSGSTVVNGSKSYTVSDADVNNVINWAKKRFFAQVGGVGPQRRNPPPPTPTNQQALLAWVQNWINETKSKVQHFITPAPPSPPAPPSFT